MRSAKRIMLVGIGGVLAVVIATVVVSQDCRHSLKSDSCPGDWLPAGMGPVLVATEDIEAGQTMDSVIEDGHLEENMVRLEALVEGAATDVSQIEGITTTRLIEKDEQISLEYLR